MFGLRCLGERKLVGGLSGTCSGCGSLEFHYININSGEQRGECFAGIMGGWPSGRRSRQDGSSGVGGRGTTETSRIRRSALNLGEI